MYDDLKARVLKKAGISSVLPRHCKLIAKDIAEISKMHISETTLKRFFGLTGKGHKFSSYTLAALNIYADSNCEVTITTKIDSPTAAFRNQKNQYHLLDSTIESTNCNDDHELNKLDREIIQVKIKLNRVQIQDLKKSINKVTSKKETKGK